MKYQCINCLAVWDEGPPGLEGYSHGLCPSCLKEALIPLYRRRQRAEGNFDCFGKAWDYCDQEICKYRRVCLNAQSAAAGLGLGNAD